MVELESILKNVEPEIARRVREALALMRKQAIGAEAYRQNAKVWTKEDDSPVTVADLLHQCQLQQLLRTSFPEDGLISEEPRSMLLETFEEASAISAEFYGVHMNPELSEVPDRGPCTWVFDPIDGTKGYLKGRYYAIALGFFMNEVPVFGAMAIPHRTGQTGEADSTLHYAFDRSLAFAIKGHGAWITKLDVQGTETYLKLDATTVDESTAVRMGMSLEHGDNLAERFKKNKFDYVKIDSQAKYLAVAAGDLDLYVRKCRGDRPQDLLWDHLPGMMLVLEAGGTICSFDGSPISMLVQDEISFVGGMICHRGPRGTEFAKSIEQAVNA
ncbi:MAG: inositol monophosphatase family protein [Sumerlaeia bacterium]